MEALAGPEPSRAWRPLAIRRWGTVPALPTLWPSMLAAPPASPAAFPFDAPNARYFYFARNAVWLAAKVLGLDRGECLVPAYHHGVEVEALVDAGVKVRFYRIDARMRPDLLDLERRIGPRTRGIYLIHYLGFPGPAEPLRALCDRRGLALVEDCALALLSRDGDVPLGQVGDASIFCLYKTLPVPHGGALVMGGARPWGLPEAPPPPWPSTGRHLLASLLANAELRGGGAGRLLRRLVRSLGRGAVAAANLEHVATGTQHFNRAHSGLGMSSLALRLALSQDFEAIVERRRRNYFLLLARLRELAPPVFHTLPPGVCPLFFPLRVRNKAAVMARLAERGVETVDFWRVGHPACDPDEFPEVGELRRRIVEIPIHQDIAPQAADGLADELVEALQEVDR